MTMTEAQHRILETNGIRMHIAEQGTGPTVVLCHGFPECWYSRRHQLSALATAGFHAVAPDTRGYGQTDALPEIERYTCYTWSATWSACSTYSAIPQLYYSDAGWRLCNNEPWSALRLYNGIFFNRIASDIRIRPCV
jgi:pimeloyl-ACP methyl ester carboxylesterase